MQSINREEAFNKIDELDQKMEDEIKPTCAYNTEHLLYAQTKAILTYLKYLLSNNEVPNVGSTSNDRRTNQE
jgi:hypothetical protein